MSERFRSVTDHAVLRYLERAKGVDVPAIRRHIAELTRRGVDKRGNAVVIEGVKFVLQGNVVTTVLDRRWHTQSARDSGGDE